MELRVEDDRELKLSGDVNWFGSVKGFGFIVSDGPKEDIFLHANVLRKYGHSSVAGSARLEFLAQYTDRGVQACKILSLEPREIEQPRLPDFDNIEPEDISALQLEPARIKWFGFANVYTSNEDIFVHIDILRRSGLTDLKGGEAIALRTLSGKRGKMAAEICPW